MSKVRIAGAVAGVIGIRHIAEIRRSGSSRLSAIDDVSLNAAEVARQAGVPPYGALDELFARDRPDGVILATPNQLHVEQALECIHAGGTDREHGLKARFA